MNYCVIMCSAVSLSEYSITKKKGKERNPVEDKHVWNEGVIVPLQQKLKWFGHLSLQGQHQST